MRRKLRDLSRYLSERSDGSCIASMTPGSVRNTEPRRSILEVVKVINFSMRLGRKVQEVALDSVKRGKKS